MSSRSSKAFSLIEVLITVAILSTGIVFLFRSYVTSLSSVAVSQDITHACFLAEQKFYEFERNYKDGVVQAESENVARINKEFICNYAVTDYQDEVGTAYKRLLLSVAWREGRREKNYSMDFATLLPGVKK